MATDAGGSTAGKERGTPDAQRPMPEVRVRPRAAARTLLR
jgi:hypothetical protein